MEGLISADSLPSADFSIADLDSEEEEEEEGPVTIFTRTGNKSVTGGDTETRNHINKQDIVVHDIEADGEEDRDLFAKNGNEIPESGNEIPESGNEIPESGNEIPESGNEDQDKEWNEFQSQFYTVLESSETMVQEATLTGQLQRLKDDLLSSGLLNTSNTNVLLTVSPEHEQTISIGTGTNQRHDKISGTDFGSSHLLQSNCFDQINENDLDMMLEVIKEEAESREATPTKEEGSSSFEWQPLVPTNQELMSQLESASVLNEAQVEEYRSVLRGSPSFKEDKKSQYSGPDSQNVIHLDLRPMNTMHFDTESHDEMSSSAKRLMALRLSGNKSSVGEDEESYDAHSWKIERLKFKNTSSSSGGESDAKTSQPVPVLEKTPPVSSETPLSPPLSRTTLPSPPLVSSARTRLTSSESISEDDVFSTLSQEGLAGPESSSQGGGGGTKSKQDGKSKRRKHKGHGRNDSGSGSENENKRRQKGRGRKDSGSSSDGEGKGKKKRSEESKKDTNKQQKSRKYRDRKDSLTQSSDDESILSSKDSPPTLPPPSRSLSEGDAESVIKSLERVKSFLQQKIELRKPPSLFNVPNTSPLFHQDVSFSDPLLSFHPSLTDTQSLLLLPLTENGFIDMDTVDLPSHALISISATHLLHTLLITWLISLIHTCTSSERKEEEEETGDSALLWRPLTVNGLQQTVVEGLPCILVTATSTGSCEITQLLSSSSLAQIINPLIVMLNLTSVNENILSELHSISTTPLSCLLSLQSDSSLISTPLSFYSHSFYSLRCLPSADSLHSTAPLQRTVCTISQTNLSNTRVVFSLLYEATIQGLDIVGLRLVYDTTYKHFPVAPLKEKEVLNEKTEATEGQGSPVIHKSHTLKQDLSDDNSSQLVLAVSFRGPNAISRIIDIIGPDDHSLAVITDPTSLSAQYGGGNSSPSSKDSTSSKSVPLVSCVRNSYWGGLELAKWFGGRACLRSGSIIGVSDAITKSERRKRQRVRFSESESEDVVIPLPEDIDYPPLISNRPALLVYPYSRVILVASPLVGPSCYSTLFSSVSEAGFDLLGIKRIRLNAKRALSLSIPMPSISYFTPSSSSPISPSINDNTISFSFSQSESGFPPLPSLLLILARENASSHVQFLLDTVTSSLSILSAKNANTLDPSVPSSGLLHVTDFSEDALKVIGSYTFTPSSSSGAKPSSVLLEDKSYKEEISLIAVSGTHSLTDALDTLDSLTATSRPNKASTRSTTGNSIVSSTKPTSRDEEGLGGFELLGIKIVPSLSRFQAKQLCHHPQFSAGFSEMVDSLFAKPVLLLLVRGISCNERVWKLLKGSDNHDILLGNRKSSRIICSDDFNKAFYLSTLFFIDKELFSDSDVWPWAHLVPPAWINDCAILSSLSVDPEPLLSVFTITISHMTLLVKVLEKLSRSGFRFVGMKLTEGDQSDKFVVAVCVERHNAVWYLAHQLQLFTHSSNSYSKAIYYSPTFMSAVADVQFYFPCGSVHTLSSALLKYYQVSSDPSVSAGPISPRSKVTATPYEGLTPPTSPLSEDAYLILPPSYLSPSPSASSYTCLPFITVLDVLTRASFSLTDILMTQLSRKMAQEILLLVNTKLKEDDLYKDGPDGRPCIVIGIRRDNAASCFQSIISNFLLHCSLREDTVSIGRIFDGLIVTGTAQQTAAVRSVFKNTQSQSEQ